MVLRAIQPGQLNKRIHVQIGKHRGLYAQILKEEVLQRSTVIARGDRVQLITDRLLR